MPGDLNSQTMVNIGGIEVTPVQTPIDLSGRSDFVKLDADSWQRAQVSALVSQFPTMMATEAMSHGYYLEFPEGLQGKLMDLRQGGKASTVADESGRIRGTASLYETDKQVAILGAFNAMAIMSGQYFLSEINSNLKMMKLNLDKILEFLYGDKKAELMAEMSFVKYAYQNYQSIMAHDTQRLATIVSLQEARKVAMKDIEFYMRDLETTVNSKESGDLNELIGKALQIRDSLELSVQLCLVSSLLEVYYSENYDKNYISYVEKDLASCIAKFDRQIIGSFAVIGEKIQTGEGKYFKKAIDAPKKEEIYRTIELLKRDSEEDSTMRTYLRSALTAPLKKQEYFIGADGNVFLKTV